MKAYKAAWDKAYPDGKIEQFLITGKS
jgi:hypothetical protein